MASTCQTVTCPDNCNDPLPIPLFNLCNPKFLFGQIINSYVTNIGNPLNDENDPVEWANRLALPSNDPSKIIKLVGMGEMPNPDLPGVDASHGRKAYGEKERLVNFTIDELSDENYEFMRGTECGKQVLAWFETSSGKALGGPEGIKCTMFFGHAIPLSTAELENLPGTFRWKSKISPCRFDHPLHGDDSDLES